VATALLHIKPILLSLNAIPAMFDCVRTPVTVLNIDDEAEDLRIAQKLHQSIRLNQVKRLSNYVITSYLKKCKQNDDQAFDSENDSSDASQTLVAKVAQAKGRLRNRDRSFV
jgi:hypothetical protein